MPASSPAALSQVYWWLIYFGHWLRRSELAGLYGTGKDLQGQGKCSSTYVLICFHRYEACRFKASITFPQLRIAIARRFERNHSLFPVAFGAVGGKVLLLNIVEERLEVCFLPNW